MSDPVEDAYPNMRASGGIPLAIFEFRDENDTLLMDLIGGTPCSREPFVFEPIDWTAWKPSRWHRARSFVSRRIGGRWFLGTRDYTGPSNAIRRVEKASRRIIRFLEHRDLVQRQRVYAREVNDVEADDGDAGDTT